VRRIGREWVTGGLVAALAVLTSDAVSGGLLSSAEARACRAPGPAPRWARGASRASEREALGLVVLVAVGRRRHAGLPVWPPVVRVAGGVAARQVFSTAVRRPRPPRSWWRAAPEGWSFPSRHTTHAVLAASVLLEELAPTRPAAQTVGALTAATVVGASRVRLGVHWPSDVVAGALTGLAWIRVTAGVARLLRGHD
jgi:undecaprenyl-diphosphatase